MSAAADICPRCRGVFHCGVNDAEPCACTRIALEAAMLARLRSEYAGCLCVNCLLDLQRAASPSARCSTAPSAAPSN